MLIRKSTIAEEAGGQMKPKFQKTESYKQLAYELETIQLKWNTLFFFFFFKINATDDKYKILSVPEKTELHIQNLHIKNDQDSYICEGSNEISAANATIVLRVRSRLAALWPFLGIVAEVIVLVTVIFIYEKRRKPDEVLDDDDAGATPL
ncbi:basigin [Protopterus annectens]|uniref:basigin n=1 Tax=Protopterus annectens TaxID=7888 RepID=UPI001CFBCF52|nr:basigin [Protopterus annectens]